MTPFPWPLPDRAHVPGRTPRPADSPAFDAARTAPPVTVPVNWHRDMPYLYGHHLYKHGFFWEAHEVWEPIWMGCVPNSRERTMIQGLIQLTNACLKINMGRHRAALRLVSISIDHFTEACNQSAPVMGLDPNATRDRLLQFKRRLCGDALVEVLAHRPAIAPNQAI